MTTPALDLDAIEKACALATPGPWEWGEFGMTAARPRYNDAGDYATPDDERRAWAGEIITTDSGAYGPLPHDQAFIAGARDWVPALLARVREVEGHLKRIASLYVVEYGPNSTQGETVLVGDSYHVTMRQDIKVRLATVEDARAQEREACAKLAETMGDEAASSGPWADLSKDALLFASETAKEIAAAIRARGEGK